MSNIKQLKDLAHLILRIMSVTALVSRLATALFLGTSVSAFAEPPEKVVSVNLCTDQMAMMLSDQDQLISISYLTLDPHVSEMAQQASNIPINHGGLEEIVALSPDLVLAHEWSSPFLISGLRDFGVNVAIFSTPRSLEEVPNFISNMGKALGKEIRASRMIAEYQSEYMRLRLLPKGENEPSLLTYGPNGWVSGVGDITAEAIEVSGFEYAAGNFGLENGGFMPLEILVSTKPDVILTALPYAGSSRAESIMTHPALKNTGAKIYAMKHSQGLGCGLPQSLDAVHELISLRRGFL